MEKIRNVVLFPARKFILKYTNNNTIIAYDILKATAALQGIVNRKYPCLFIDFTENFLAKELKVTTQKSLDKFWFDELRKKKESLHKAKIEIVSDFFDLIEYYKDKIKGWVIWDEDVPATANVASTISGALDLIPIRGSYSDISLMNKLFKLLPQKNIVYDLRKKFTGKGIIADTKLKSTGSKKCDAYIWASEKFLKTGLCSPLYFAHYVDGIKWNECPAYSSQLKNYTIKSQFDSPYPDLDNAGLPNSDFYISKKAFFFDLSPWTDEIASDDITQLIGTDGKTLRKILQTANQMTDGKQIITIGGFTPWWLKYCDIDWYGKRLTRGKRDGVATEWESVDIFSAYNAVLDADAYGLIGYGNASFYTHLKLTQKFKPPQPLTKKLKNKIYIMFMMGDYDSAAWFAQMPALIWNDRKRGDVPLAWSINPLLAERAPQAYNYILRTRKKTDCFGAQEGAAYINTNMLLDKQVFSNLPDASEAYQQFAKKWYNKIGLRHTIFTIFTHTANISTKSMKLFSTFSPDGVGIQQGRTLNCLYNNTPFIACRNDFNYKNSNDDFVKTISQHISRPVNRAFYFFRCVLVSPTQISNAVSSLEKIFPKERFEICDMVSFFSLLKSHYKELDKIRKQKINEYTEENKNQKIEFENNNPITIRCDQKSCDDFFIPIDKWGIRREKAMMAAEAKFFPNKKNLILQVSINNKKQKSENLVGSWMLFLNLPQYDWGTKWLFKSDGNQIKTYAGEILCTVHHLNKPAYLKTNLIKQSAKLIYEISILWERIIDPFIEYPEIKTDDIIKSKIQACLVLIDKEIPNWEKTMVFGLGPRPEMMKTINLKEILNII